MPALCRRTASIVTAAKLLAIGFAALGFGVVPAGAATPTFGAPTQYPNGSFGVAESHGTVAAADFNGDGTLDLAIADFAGGQVRVLPNRGDGTFAAAALYKTGALPSAVAAADVDGDGRLDIVVGHIASGSITLLHNSGSGSFTIGASYPAGLSPTRILVGDYNHDGRSDLAVASYLGVANLTIFSGAPGGVLVKSQTLSVGTLVLMMDQGDLNGDGTTDLVLGEFIGRIDIVLGRGDGTFAPASTLQVLGLEDLAIIDVNGDAHEDLVVPVVSSNKVSTFLGHGNATFAAPINSKVNPTPALLWPQTFVVAVTSGDLNGDGHPDLVVGGGTDRNLYVMTGNGTGQFSTAETYAAGMVARAVVLRDLNGDHRLDLVCAGFSQRFSVFLHMPS